MILPYPFLYNKKFYFIAFFLLVLVFGTFGLIYQKDLKKREDASVQFYNAILDFDKGQKEALETLSNSNVLPYSDIAKMYIAAFYAKSSDTKDQASLLYKDVIEQSKVEAIKDLAQFYQSAISGSFVESDGVYDSTYQILKAAHMQDVDDQDARKILENMNSSLDSTEATRSLAARLLEVTKG